MKIITRIILTILTAILLQGGPVAYATSTKSSKQKSTVTTTEKKSSKKSSSKTKKDSDKKGKSTSAKKQSSKKSNNKKGTPKKETSADVTRQKNEAQKEIRVSTQQLAANEASLRTNLGDLQRLGADIATSENQVRELSTKISGLSEQIKELESSISAGKEQLQQMRTKYLAAVKQMRLKRGDTSVLAFIFSADNFNQALRRMRYLGEFSRWRDRQTKAITAKVKELEEKEQLLTQTKRGQDIMLAQEMQVKSSLETQQQQKNVIVSELKRNSESLRAYIAKKQGEVNSLNQRISQLIAAEQEAERQRAAEQRRRQEEQRQRQEEQRKKEEQNKQIAENSTSKESKQTAAKDKKSSSKDKKETQTSKQKQNKTTQQNNNSSSSNNEYAAARKRRPRSNAESNSLPQDNTAVASVSKNGFESAKGSLPRPASGSFKIVSPYGRHAKPGLPDVVYDNPGIDIEVSPGAVAKSVYEGKVTGVYKADGYSHVVLVKHGNYYTVYGNLSSVSVQTGQTVRQGDTLGQIASDTEDRNRTTLHFEVWKERNRQNPTDWIR
jgi:septal ring factor EnvC (AmiA/AmiB activator)